MFPSHMEKLSLQLHLGSDNAVKNNVFINPHSCKFTGVFYIHKWSSIYCSAVCYNQVIMSDTIPLLVLNIWKKNFEHELVMSKTMGEVILLKVSRCPTDCNGIIFLNLHVPFFSIKMLLFHFPDVFSSTGEHY